MSMIEQIVSVVVATLVLQLIGSGLKQFMEWKNDKGRKQRIEVRKHDRQLRRELLDLGITKGEL